MNTLLLLLSLLQKYISRGQKEMGTTTAVDTNRRGCTKGGTMEARPALRQLRHAHSVPRMDRQMV